MPNRNALFLSLVTTQAKDAILASIAAHYGITPDEAYAEVAADDAEHLLEYLVGAQRTAASALMQRYGVRA
jgi:hypothetical protein